MRSEMRKSNSYNGDITQDLGLLNSLAREHEEGIVELDGLVEES